MRGNWFNGASACSCGAFSSDDLMNMHRIARSHYDLQQINSSILFNERRHFNGEGLDGSLIQSSREPMTKRRQMRGFVWRQSSYCDV